VRQGSAMSDAERIVDIRRSRVTHDPELENKTIRNRHPILLPAVLLLFAAACMALSTPAVSQDMQADTERILLFRSDITVHEDSSMTVQETIQVVSTGNEIQRGIYRDFPTRYKGKYGSGYVVGFEVVEVLRDGKPEPYHMADQENGKRVYIGDPDVNLSPGRYRYSLTYKTDRQLGYFEDHDELYWNVTGNGWSFPIDRAEAAVTLPTGISGADLKLDGYTGPQGSKAKDFIAHVDKFGHVVFVTTAPLGVSEGLTIVVSWPKGFVAEPTSQERMGYFLRDNRGILAGLVGLIVVLLYYVVAWSRVGNDPERGTIIPLYTPPEGLSPAAVRYVARMGYDNKSFTAALINMAVKRFIRIEEDDHVYTIIKDKADETVLSPEEQGIAVTLLGSEDSIKLTDERYATVGAALKAAKEALKTRCSRYFSTNSLYLVPGLILSMATVGFSAVLTSAFKAVFVGFMGLWVAGWTFGVIALVSQAGRAWRDALRGTGNPVFSSLGAGCLTVFALPFIAGEVFGLYMLGSLGSPPLILLILLIAFVNYLFYQLLKAPTIPGRRLLDQIEGFKMYLSVAEKDSLDALTPGGRTPELFERYLPYALALGVEQAWAQRFADVLSRAAAGGEPYRPGWYSGRSWSSTDPTGFASSLGGSLSGAISSSSSPPGSSSGGGGGGSSGGGGGGGGGGGW